MVPSPLRREVRMIKKGKYAHFEKLLSPLEDPSSLPGGKQKKSKYMRQVCDLGSWLAGSMEHLRRYSGPDRSQYSTGAGEE